MNLIEALELLAQPVPEDAPRQRIFLAAGFAPLHLKTFLAAHLRKANPRHRIEIETGLFGDLPGNLNTLQTSNFDAIAVPIEWSDLDPRLGIRRLGGWRNADLPDIVESAEKAMVRLAQALSRASTSVPTICSLPTLPLPPLFSARSQESGTPELLLRQMVASFGARISQETRIRIVNAQNLDELSPLRDRLDAKSDMMTGFPYQLAHASVLAESLVTLIINPLSRKGLITDLDDTLWSGILGEVGVDHVCWSLEGQAHEHGLYQQFLASLASAGVLIAIASKNDADLVEQAFARKDLLLTREMVFPFEVHWSQKSESVERILKAWNITADSVVFIDDSPMEIAEVKAAFPDLECFVFPKGDYQALWNLLKRLRDLFGKSVISDEDSIRLQSIRNARLPKPSIADDEHSLDDFLEKAKASIIFAFETALDVRAFELINKTNQFNLNGRRLTESAWMNYLKDSESFLLTAVYQDKFGPLGKIAAILGRKENKKLRVSSWVMSCRAFSRRIEYQCLNYLFEKMEVDEMEFDYQATDRNGPIREFFTQISGVAPNPPLQLSRTSFFKHTPLLFHHIEETPIG
jgi:FkbH-like protein